MSALTEAHDAMSDVENLLEVLFDACMNQPGTVADHFGGVVRITIEKLNAVDERLSEAIEQEAKRRPA